MRPTIAAQAVYYLLTGIWPLVSMGTFEMVTGPKTDDWLVQMVGLLAAAIGATLLVGAIARFPSREIVVLSVLTAIAFAAVDIVYSLNGTISRIYLADAVIQGVFLVGVAVGWVRRRLQPIAD
jgi:hypothetical protein